MRASLLVMKPHEPRIPARAGSTTVVEHGYDAGRGGSPASAVTACVAGSAGESGLRCHRSPRYRTQYHGDGQGGVICGACPQEADGNPSNLASNPAADGTDGSMAVCPRCRRRAGQTLVIHGRCDDRYRDGRRIDRALGRHLRRRRGRVRVRGRDRRDRGARCRQLGPAAGENVGSRRHLDLLRRQRAHRGRRRRGARLPEGNRGGDHARGRAGRPRAGHDRGARLLRAVGEVERRQGGPAGGAGELPIPGHRHLRLLLHRQRPGIRSGRPLSPRQQLPADPPRGRRPPVQGHGGQHRAAWHHRMARIAGGTPRHRGGRVRTGTHRHDPDRQPAASRPPRASCSRAAASRPTRRCSASGGRRNRC